MSFVIPLLAAGIGAGVSASQSHQQQKSLKTQANVASAQNAATVQAAKDAEANAAAKAQETINQRKRAMRSSETIYTSPLGISGQANVAKKTLLGQ